MSNQKLSSTRTDLGICIIDTYRAPGDLYDSWDLTSWNDGNPSRLPDARYGAYEDFGDYDDMKPSDYQPLHLFEITEVYNINGWTKRQTRIEDDEGWTIAYREG